MPEDWYSSLVNRLATSSEEDQTSVQSSAGIWNLIAQRLDIAQYKPKANPDVLVKEMAGRKEVYFVLKNTKEKTYLRLSLEEHDLWQRMDRNITAQDLIVEHFMETGKFSHLTSIRLIEQLLQHHMLVEQPINAWSQVKWAVFKRTWTYRLTAPAQFIITPRLSINIDSFIERIYKYGGWLCFTKVAQVLFVLISVIGLGAFFMIVSDTRHRFFSGHLIAGLAALWLAAILPVVIHELGHALTVKHYGREVPRGGVMLYMGMPVAFVETTDIWLEPRRARLAVTWNGPYTGLILGGLASLFIVTFPTAAINSLLFKMAAIAYSTFYMNLNPLLRFDGYHLLSDALDISSLREKSAVFLRHGFLDKITQRKHFSRQDWIFTIYGALSAIWTIVAIYLIYNIWGARLRDSFEVLVQSNYSWISKLFSLLVLAALASIIFLLALKLFQVVGLYISRFIHSGILQQHIRMALIGAGLALLIGIGVGSGLTLILPQSEEIISVTTGCLLSVGTAILLVIFNKPYWGSARGIGYLSFALALALSGFAQLTQLLPETITMSKWFEWMVILALCMGGLSLCWPPVSRLGYRLLIGLLVGVIAGAGLCLISGTAFGNTNCILTFGLVTASLWGLLGVRGGARSPAVVLVYLGGFILVLSWFWELPLVDLKLISSLFLVAGGLHLVYARLPELSAYDSVGIFSQTQKAIGSSVAIIVRRVIAQVFFESGWPGIGLVGRDFSNAMRRNGIALSIEINQFRDQELPARSAVDLTDVYGLAFEELHTLVCRELGRQMGRWSFGFGLDLLPWQIREVISEVILSRTSWGRQINQEMKTRQAEQLHTLKRVPLFVSCTDEELERVVAVMVTERYATGELIIRQGDPGDKFYILQRGKANVWQMGVDGVERLVDKKGPGQYFGEVALVSKAPRNATVRAETPIVLYSIGHEEFDRLIRQYVDLAQQVDSEVKYSWLLRSMPIFDELNSRDLDQFARRMERETCQAGQVLFHEGDPGDKFYIVESGQLVVTRTINGDTVELSRREAGDYVGEIALLQDLPRTATITCGKDTVLLSLKAEYFHELVSKSMRVSEMILRTGSRRLTFVQMAEKRMGQSTGLPEG
jgi:putative peptide zinc metalloprotease protein